MAFELLADAWESQLPLTTHEKIVLVHLVNFTHSKRDADHGLSWCSITTIARHCSMTRQGVIDVLERLTSRWVHRPTMFDDPGRHSRRRGRAFCVWPPNFVPCVNPAICQASCVVHEHNPRYCVEIARKGDRRLSTRYRVLMERVMSRVSGQPGLPLNAGQADATVVNPIDSVVNPVKVSGQPGLPNPEYPDHWEEERARRSRASLPRKAGPSQPLRPGQTGAAPLGQNGQNLFEPMTVRTRRVG